MASSIGTGPVVPMASGLAHGVSGDDTSGETRGNEGQQQVPATRGWMNPGRINENAGAVETVATPQRVHSSQGWIVQEDPSNWGW